MSASGQVRIRLVRFTPAAENPPTVMPAPKMSSLAAVVVMAPLLAVAVLPAADCPRSKGAVGSSPLYSVMRKSIHGAAALKVTVTVFAPAAAALILVAK